ncbi:hypothetical protein [Saccharobesus litoralis]|nr:hypothetical protein [Saccharobesus litoralis]
MKKDNPTSSNFESELSEAYQRDKAHYQLPVDVQQRIIAQAARQSSQSRSRPKTNLTAWWALAASVFVAFLGVQIIDASSTWQSEAELVYQPTNLTSEEAITINVIEPNLQTRLAAEILTDHKKYQAYKNTWQQQVANLNATYQGETNDLHYMQLARLTKQDSQLRLVLCEQAKAKVLENFTLRHETTSPTQFNLSQFTGSQMVQLVLNRQGDVIAIRSLNQSHSC